MKHGESQQKALRQVTRRLILSRSTFGKYKGGSLAVFRSKSAEVLGMERLMTKSCHPLGAKQVIEQPIGLSASVAGQLKVRLNCKHFEHGSFLFNQGTRLMNPSISHLQTTNWGCNWLATNILGNDGTWQPFRCSLLWPSWWTSSEDALSTRAMEGVLFKVVGDRSLQESSHNL